MILRFPEQSNPLRLLEVADGNLLRAIKEGKEYLQYDNLYSSSLRLQIRGQPDEEAVITTDSQTFRLRLVETSNTLLILDKKGQDDDLKVVAMGGSLLEAVPMIGKIDRLEQLLRKHPYAGPEDPLQLEQDFDSLQLSRLEAERALESLQAVLIDGHYRLVCPKYTSRFFQYLTSLAVEDEWDLEGLSLDRVIQKFQETCREEFPPPIITELCRVYGETIAVNGNVFKLSSVKVSRFFGIELLKSQKAK